MFGSLGMPELLLILVIALIVFGPKKLPEVGRSLGKAMREFKRTTEDIKGKFEEQINAEEFKDIKSGFDDIKTEIKSVVEMPIPAQSGADVPARTETGAAGTARAATGTDKTSDSPDPASQHGEG
jgi:sec-independent protein translocase protein TatA